MLKESGDNKVAHITFFGGETLLNFPVLQEDDRLRAAARRRARQGASTSASPPTATLLKPDIIEFLADEPRRRDHLDRRSEGSAGQVPRLPQRQRQLRHRRAEDQRTAEAAPQPADRRARHADVGDAGRQADLPAPHRGDRILGGRLRAGDDVAEPRSTPSRIAATTRCSASSAISPTSSSSASVANRHHGFSNVKETLEELHKGVSKAFPCGAGLGLLGVATDGDVALCHRFAGSDAHKFGTVARRHRSRRAARVPRVAPHRQQDRLPAPAGRGRSARAAATTKRTRATARRRGRTCTTATGSAAGPTSACRIYGELSERNPAFLTQFDRPMTAERVS